MYGLGVTQPVNNDLYFSVVKKDIERTFNKKQETDPLYRWNFTALKAFPVKKGACHSSL
jgi:hypothetical protein